MGFPPLSSPPSIAIVGGGPAGLTLMRILDVHLRDIDPLRNPKVTIFERDANQHSQTDQIGTLDLHTNTGLAAMKAAELFEEFQKHARYDGEELVIADKNGTELVHMHAGKGTTPGVEATRPEIDRATLMEILLASVGTHRIIWGKKLTSVTEDKKLCFADGSIFGPYDLIVGADGTWGKVRPILTSVRPRYSGICGFESLIVDPDIKHPAIANLFGRGAYFAFSDGKAMMAHRLGSGNIKLNYWIKSNESFHSDVMKQSDGQDDVLRDTLHDLYTDWLPILRKCIDVSQRFKSRALYELPIGDRWDHRLGFTLMGDSAHLMTPFSGKGANAAMRDGLDLAGAVIESLTQDKSLDECIKSYEEQMFMKIEEVQSLTMMNKQGMFREDAPVGFMVDMMDVIAKAKGKDLNKGVLAWIPVKKMARLVAWVIVTAGAWKRRFTVL
ncbi:hypothetical protein E4T42_07729 [Aureobasidium subglaciale]|nr:hypothetical protein E4T42_07729 [Aureobasidium subglaciale]